MNPEVDAFPPLLRALLDEELAAGNEISEIGHSFPAPPAGAYIRLKNVQLGYNLPKKILDNCFAFFNQLSLVNLRVFEQFCFVNIILR